MYFSSPVSPAVLLLTAAAVAVYLSVTAVAVARRNAPSQVENWAIASAALHAERMQGTIRGGQAEVIKPRVNARSPEWFSSDSVPNGDGKGGDSIPQSQKWRDWVTWPNDDGKKENSLRKRGRRGGVGPGTGTALRRQTAPSGREGGGRKQHRWAKTDRKEDSKNIKAEAAAATAAAGGLAPGSPKKGEIPGLGSTSELVSEDRSFHARRQRKDRTVLLPPSEGTESDRHSIDPPKTTTPTAAAAAGTKRTRVEGVGNGKEGGGWRGGGGGGVGTKDGEENSAPIRSSQSLSPANRSPLHTAPVYRHAGPSVAQRRAAAGLPRSGDGGGGGGRRRRGGHGGGTGGGGGDSQNGKPRRPLQNPPTAFSFLSSSQGRVVESIVFRPDTGRRGGNEVRGIRTDPGPEPRSLFAGGVRSSRRVSASFGGRGARQRFDARGQEARLADEPKNGDDPARKRSEVILPSAPFASPSPSPSPASSDRRLRFPAPARAVSCLACLPPTQRKPATDGVHPLGHDTRMKEMPTLGREAGRGGNRRTDGKRKTRRRVRRDVNNHDNLVVSVGDFGPDAAGSGLGDVDSSGGGAEGGAKLAAASTASLAGNQSSWASSVGGDAFASNTGAPLTVTSVTGSTTGATSSSVFLSASSSSSFRSSLSSSLTSLVSSSSPTPAPTSTSDDAYEATSTDSAAVPSFTPTSTSLAPKVLPSSTPLVTNTTTAPTQSTNSPTTILTDNLPLSTSLDGMTSLAATSSSKSYTGMTSAATSTPPSDKPDASFTPARALGSHPTSQVSVADSPADVIPTSSADNNGSTKEEYTKSSTDLPMGQDGVRSTRTSTAAISRTTKSSEYLESVTSSRKSPTEEGWTSGANSVSPTDASSKRTTRSTDAETSGTPTQPGVKEAQGAPSTTTTTTSTTGARTTPAVAESVKPAVASPTSSIPVDHVDVSDAGKTGSAIEPPVQTAVTTSTVSPSHTKTSSSDPEVNSATGVTQEANSTSGDVTPEVNSTIDAVTPEVNSTVDAVTPEVSSTVDAVTPEVNSTVDAVTPEVNSTSDVSSEEFFGSAWTAEPEPYPEPGDKTPGVDEETGEGDEEGVAEPGPDWIVAKALWKEAWEIHLYVFGGLFGGLGIYILVCVIRLWRSHRLLSRRYFVSLNLLMLLLCATRAVYLTMDGYNSRGTFHPSLDYFLYSISFPCLTSAFSIQLYALLQATRMQFLPPTIQKMSMLMTIVGVHFAISITTDVVVGLYAGMEVMLFVCQLFFVFWGLFLFFGYAYIFRRLYVHAVKRQKNASASVYNHVAVGSSGGGGTGSGPGLVKPKRKFTLSVAVTVTMLTAVLGLVTVGLELYGLVGVYKTFSTDRPAPWPWYIYHTSLRLVEFLMCATMGYVASQPFRYRRDHQRCCCPVLCAPCAEICYCGNDVTRSEPQAGWSEIDQHQLRASFDRSPHPPPQGLQGNGHVGDGLKGGAVGGGDDGRSEVTTKTRICFSDHDDVIRPVVTSQPGTMTLGVEVEEGEEEAEREGEDGEDESNTLSTRGSLSGGSGSYQGSGGLNSPTPGGRRQQQQQQNPVAVSNHDSNSINASWNHRATPPGPGPDDVIVSSTPSRPQQSSFAPTGTCNGVVNTGYVPTSSDANDRRPPAGGSATPAPLLPSSWAEAVAVAVPAVTATEETSHDCKSRKGSSASSDFFLGPYSVSLADSMASELDKAFRSMHEDDDQDAGDVFTQQDRPASSSSLRLEQRQRGAAVVEAKDGAEKVSPRLGLHGELRRSNSATGRGSFVESLHPEERLKAQTEEEPRTGEKGGGGGRERWGEEGGVGRSDPTPRGSAPKTCHPNHSEDRPGRREAIFTPTTASNGNDTRNTPATPSTTTPTTPAPSGNPFVQRMEPNEPSPPTPQNDTAHRWTSVSKDSTSPPTSPPLTADTRAAAMDGESPVGVKRGRRPAPRRPDDGADVRAGPDNGRSSANRDPVETRANGGKGNFLLPSVGGDTAPIDSAAGNSATNIPVANDAATSNPRAVSDVDAAGDGVISRPVALTSRARASAAPYCTVIPVTAKSRSREEKKEKDVATSVHGPHSSGSHPSSLPRLIPALTAGPSVNNSNNTAPSSSQSLGDRSQQSVLPADSHEAPTSADSSPLPSSSHESYRGYHHSPSPSQAPPVPFRSLAPRGGAVGAGSAVTRPLCKGLLGYGLDDGDDIEV